MNGRHPSSDIELQLAQSSSLIDDNSEIVIEQIDDFGPQDLYARREKIFTRSISGFYQRLRALTGWPLLIGYFGLPWLQFDGRQAVLFDLPARQFHIFGLTIWPQDLWLLGWMLMISAFALFAITTMVGRLWCGYTCPQTVWTAIFMWIEQFAEGSRHQRIRLNQAGWSISKVRKRLMKHGMWLGVALFTGIGFVGYFTPIRELMPGLVSFDIDLLGSWAGLWVAFFTLATYFNAGWLREQVCIYMCPYARFQSAMIDADTLTVAYDTVRGEPRGARKRGALRTQSELGDCIDCTLCVQVCPTGIDIRDGLQYECIGCAHCIDACDQVMKQMGYVTGLIGYRSERSMAGEKVRVLRPRSLGYAGITFVLCGALLWALANRDMLTVDVLRDRGALYQVDSSGMVHNDYQLVALNKSQRPQRVQLAVRPGSTTSTSDFPGIPSSVRTEFEIGPGSLENLPLRLSAPAGEQTIIPIVVSLCELPDGRCAEEDTNFFGPGSDLLHAQGNRRDRE